MSISAMPVKMLVTLILSWMITAACALAAEPLRPMSSGELKQEGLTEEMGVPIMGAQVAWANYSLIRHDFPQIAHFSDAQIANWLIQNFAYIGSKQHQLNGIRQTPIQTDSLRKGRKIFRPNEWHRSGVMTAPGPSGEDIGMVDIKGIGLGAQRNPTRGLDIETQVAEFRTMRPDSKEMDHLRSAPYSNGLMSLGEAVAELTRQTAVQRLLEAHDILLETVETYAVFSLPFSILKPAGQEDPAAFYLRQAHVGRRSLTGVPSSVLRDEEGHRQSTRSGTLVDFGGVEVTDPLLQERFGMVQEGAHFTAQGSKPWSWGHEVAQAYVHGDRKAIERHLEEMTAPLDPRTPESHQLSPKRARFRSEQESLIRKYRAEARLDDLRLTPDISVVQMLLNDPDPSISGISRELVLDGLRHSHEAQIRELYSQMILNDKSPWARRNYIMPLIEMGTRESLQTLALLFEDQEAFPSPHLIDFVLAQTEGSHDKTSALLNVLFKNSRPEIRRKATFWLASNANQNKDAPEVLAFLEKATQDPDQSVRQAALEILEKNEHPEFAQIRSDQLGESCSAVFSTILY